MVELLRKNNAICKNVLSVSDAPEDFKKAMFLYVDESRHSIAIIVLRNVHGKQYAPEKVRHLKA